MMKKSNNSTNEKTPKSPNAILWYPSKVQINRVQVSYAHKINYPLTFASCFHVPTYLSYVAMIHGTGKKMGQKAPKTNINIFVSTKQ